MNRKRLGILLLTAALLMGLAACSQEQEDTRIKIGICVYDMEDDFMAQCAESIKSQLPQSEYAVYISDGKNNQTSQTAQILAFIEQGYDALIVNPVMVSSTSEIVSSVSQAGIPTVFLEREPEETILESWDKLYYVGSDAAEPGTLQGQIILELPNKGDVNDDEIVSYVALQGIADSIDTRLRTENAINALADADVTLSELGRSSTDGSQNAGQDACAKLLAKLGKDIEVVFCNNDALALGALEAIKDGGRTVGEDIFLVGIDGTEDALEQVKAGTLTGTVLLDMKPMADKAAETIKALFSSQSIPKRSYINCQPITQENVDNYLN